MEFTIKIHRDENIEEYKATKGTNLLHFLRKHTSSVSAPCGGKGKCGKCKVRTDSISGVSESEKKLLGSKMIAKGYRLACYINIASDMDIFIDESTGKPKIATHWTEIRKEKNLKPLFIKRNITAEIPSLKNQKSDFERLMNSSGLEINGDIDILKELPEVLRECNSNVTCVIMDKKVLAVESGDTTKKIYGLAIDIGTTTVAAYLVSLTDGSIKSVYSDMNPQRKYGFDVISRINYTIEKESGTKDLKDAVISCINSAAVFTSRSAGIDLKDIYGAVIVGNTTMLHLVMGLPVRNISVSPFIPVTTALNRIKAKDIEININPYGQILLLPSVSSYIGADTLSAVMSSGMHDSGKMSLLIDLGTNGEIVLGNSKRLYACSVAAGPAFEGANIRNGMGGVEGAIDSVKISSEVEFTTIGNSDPKGLCGSGILDALSGLLEVGLVDKTGRMLTLDECKKIYGTLWNRIIKVDGINSFLVYEDKNEQIVITQRDIRELQNAKGAVAAGIKTLALKAGIELCDIERVYLAGGFGSYINIKSAHRIGLIPKELSGKIKSIGNAAGNGAVEILTSSKALKKLQKIKDIVTYIELSSDPHYVEEYINCMGFLSNNEI